MTPYPRVVLCTILLNEMEWLPRLYAQHRHWPGKLHWVFVEGADAEYAKVNLDRVTTEGLSVDGTSEWLTNLQQQDRSVTYIRHGIAEHSDPAQGKCQSRQRYLDAAEAHRPDFLVVLDADEFYPKRMQEKIAATVVGNDEATGFCFRHREIWWPPCRTAGRDELFAQEAVGGFWSIPYCRVWRWRPGLRYSSNHNTPETTDGRGLDERLARYDLVDGAPYCCHMAFASSAASREAKHRYYEERGEAMERRRRWYCESRRAWFTWKPGQSLPYKGEVRRYDGLVPEVFR